MSCEIQPARHNRQPTHQQGTEKTCMAWPISTKNANFGPNLVVFGQKILFFTGEIKSIVTHITEKNLGTLFTLVFGLALDKMCKKLQYLAQNDQKCRFWTKFGRFWARNPNYMII